MVNVTPIAARLRNTMHAMTTKYQSIEYPMHEIPFYICLLKSQFQKEELFYMATVHNWNEIMCFFPSFSNE
jgi:hypothetical protein